MLQVNLKITRLKSAWEEVERGPMCPVKDEAVSNTIAS